MERTSSPTLVSYITLMLNCIGLDRSDLQNVWDAIPKEVFSINKENKVYGMSVHFIVFSFMLTMKYEWFTSEYAKASDECYKEFDDLLPNKKDEISESKKQLRELVECFCELSVEWNNIHRLMTELPLYHEILQVIFGEWQAISCDLSQEIEKN